MTDAPLIRLFCEKLSLDSRELERDPASAERRLLAALGRATPDQLGELLAGLRALQRESAARLQRHRSALRRAALERQEFRQAARRHLAAERALALQLALSQAVLEASPDGVLVVDPDGRVLLWNEAFRVMWRISREAAESRDDARLLGEALSQLVDAEGFLARVRELYASPEASTDREDIALVDGRTFVRRSRPVRLDGVPVARIWVFHDDTEARRAEEARAQLERQLQHSQKMEAIGKLAGGVAHDFNNLLTVIRGYAELVRRQTPEGDPRHAPAAEIARGADRAAALTQQLLAFSRRQVLEPSCLDLGATVRGLEPMFRRLLGEAIRLEIDRPQPHCVVRADPGQIEQMLVNLVVNARDAMPEGGVIRVRTRAIEIGEAEAAGRGGLAPGAYAVIEVGDTGCGMDRETVSRIFEPFFTTKAPGQGTGLGLSTVYGAVRQSGGHVEVETAPGRGSTFRVWLRRVEGEPTERPARPVRSGIATGRETILLVEDDDAVRDVTGRMLAGLGYGVISARHPGEALITCERHPGEIHLVLTDMIMPHMNGKELRERIHALRPGLRALYMSGYTGLDERDRPADLEGRFLQKPFTLEDLSGKVREILDAA